MPLVFEQVTANNRIGVWRITEPEDDLRQLSRVHPAGLQGISDWKNDSRRKQWLACRALIARMLDQESVCITYDEHGKPSLQGYHGSVSFSHTQEFSAVVFSEGLSAGIDIEKIAPRIHRVADRFLQAGELEHVNRLASRFHKDHGLESLPASPVPPVQSQVSCVTELLTLLWSAKEALYKFYGRPSVDMKNDIYIDAFDYFCNSPVVFTARANSPEGVVKHELQFSRIEDHVLVFTLSQSE